MTSISQWRAGQLLQSHREQSGLSKAEAARRAGLSESWWRRLETGINIRKGEEVPVKASPEALYRAARAVGLSPIVVLEAAGMDTSTPEVRDTSLQEGVRLLTELTPAMRREAIAFMRGIISATSH
ncbi:helix-turn-helix domain-containing protein [Corynebacterium lizhenjunii]|uniref:helix-turn-helix domain-containing protein n=1 Tax=Corynebacterium lizhenjunii TaxID=2709394 RepID=UPI0013E9D7D3|nr:helix-turn-helix transcriptional regulator [Corynebacterium lizhenjunii]